MINESDVIREEEGDLSSLFDLTSAKRPELKSCYESHKQKYQSTNSINNNVFSNVSLAQPYQSSKAIYQKYENILAAPGSIYVENKQKKQKTIIEEQFQGSSRLR